MIMKHYLLTISNKVIYVHISLNIIHYCPKGFKGLILTPGPMVEETEMLLMYWPFAAAGLTLIKVSISAL